MMASQSTMDKLHDMRLSVMARAYRDQEELPAASGLSFDERLAMIVDAEWDSRRTNKRLRHLRQAGFPEQDANIADVRYDDDRKLDRAQMAELSNCSWIASRRNIIVTGASGAGKTWISNALGVAACNAFYTVRYTRLPELLDELTVFKDEEWLKQRKKYIKCDLLIIDDWLLEQVKPNEAREIMEVIEARDRTDRSSCARSSRRRHGTRTWATGPLPTPSSTAWCTSPTPSTLQARNLCASG